jgi:hypothetical protein
MMTQGLAQFIDERRHQVDEKFNNIFAFSWGKVLRRLSFLDLLEARYKKLSSELIENFTATQGLMETRPGTHPISPELRTLMIAGQHLITELHLQIESHYLFAKIALDDIARAVELYFGQSRGLSLDSHDDFSKKAEKYSASLNLTIPRGLLEAAADLKGRISDLRDYQISHDKSPRTIKGTSWSKNRGAQMFLSRMYPKETDPEHIQTEDLVELRNSLNSYIDSIVGFLKTNDDRTALKSSALPAR